MSTRTSQMEVSYNSRGTPTYRLEIWHDGLKKHRVISGSEREVSRRKAELQVEEWEERWVQVQAREKERRGREGLKQQQEAKRALAAERTEDAQKEL